MHVSRAAKGTSSKFPSGQTSTAVATLSWTQWSLGVFTRSYWSEKGKVGGTLQITRQCLFSQLRWTNALNIPLNGSHSTTSCNHAVDITMRMKQAQFKILPSRCCVEMLNLRYVCSLPSLRLNFSAWIGPRTALFSNTISVVLGCHCHRWQPYQVFSQRLEIYAGT